MISVVIIDDEPLAQEVLKDYVQKTGMCEITGICKNAFEAFSLISEQKVDLLLLDINIPGITGIEFIKSLKTPPLVIFTTAYTNHAIESYELNAVDYLVKPISFNRFLKAMNKARELISPMAKAPAQEINTSLDRLLFVRSDGKWVKIDLNNIWFVEGVKDYIRIWTDNGRIVIHSTMKNFEEQLASYSNFIRIHKSHIINLLYVQEIENNSIKIKDQYLVIGGTYRDEVQRRIDGMKMT